MTRDADAIIAQQKRKKALWMLSQQQENMDEGPDDTTPEEFMCPICYEEMLPPKRRPMMLFPCGHSLCEDCLTRQQATGRKKCPVCSTPFSSAAVNFSLKNAAEARGKAPGPQATDFAKDLVNAKARLSLLLGQLRENEARSKDVKGNLDTEQKVLDVLDQ